jgi:hypothetical protein
MGHDTAAPTQTKDQRSLYERLQEQRMQEQEQWEESHSFSTASSRLHNSYSPENLIYKGLDEDEAEFLDGVLNKESDKDLKERQELAQQLEAYKISFQHFT